MSDFLQIEDEVINGTPKYNITSNGDGTSSIILANEVVHSGTPLNKGTLDKINNVLGYNLLPYTQEQQAGGTMEFTSKQYAYQGAQWENVINSFNLNMKVKINQSYAAAYTGTAGVDNYSLFCSYGNLVILEVDSAITKFDMEGGATYLVGSNDGTNWTNYHQSSSGKTNIPNIYKYYRLDDSVNAKYKNFIVGTLNKNKYTYDKPVTTDKQILKATVSYNGSAFDNTLNGKQIDTVLQSGHYYELMFDEPNDRFIAYEARV